MAAKVKSAGFQNIQNALCGKILQQHTIILSKGALTNTILICTCHELSDLNSLCTLCQKPKNVSNVQSGNKDSRSPVVYKSFTSCSYNVILTSQTALLIVLLDSFYSDLQTQDLQIIEFLYKTISHYLIYLYQNRHLGTAISQLS